MSTITTTTIAVQTAIPDPPARRVTIHARPRSTALARYRDPRPAGAIYALASVLDDGPTGSWLRGEAFRSATTRVRAAFGAL